MQAAALHSTLNEDFSLLDMTEIETIGEALFAGEIILFTCAIIVYHCTV